MVHSKKSLFQWKFSKESYHFNRNSQIRSVMQKWSNWTSGVGQKIRLLVLLGIRLHSKTSDSLRLRLRNHGHDRVHSDVSTQIYSRPRIYCRPAMSNRNYLLSQKLCHYLNQGRTLNDILMRVAYSKAYFDLNLLSANALKMFAS